MEMLQNRIAPMYKYTIYINIIWIYVLFVLIENLV